MNLQKNQSVAVGIFLIAIGVVALFGLWNLLLPGILAVAGVVVYTQRQRAGRTIEAVQAGMWCFGLALLFAFHALWPGILFLAGLSILARGREFDIDDRVQRLLGRARGRSMQRTPPTQHVPVTMASSEPSSQNEAATNETRRLN
jgi:lysylphosphatidylglycerol synthetase-like protein (DUF2156 family)